MMSRKEKWQGTEEIDLFAQKTYSSMGLQFWAANLQLSGHSHWIYKRFGSFVHKLTSDARQESILLVTECQNVGRPGLQMQLST